MRVTSPVRAGGAAGASGAAGAAGGRRVDGGKVDGAPAGGAGVEGARAEGSRADAPAPPPPGAVLGGVKHRERVRLTGRVHSIRVQPWAGVPAYELTLVDPSGTMTVVFLGRRSIPGVGPGTKLTVEGTVGSHRGRLAMLNPSYEIVAAASGDANGMAV